MSEGYPNGMNAYYTYSPVGEATGLEYRKTTDCSSNCSWFHEAVVPSIHGQWLSQDSSLSSKSYAYDGAGRLTQVQDTPTSGGCTTRSYEYDEEGNRLALEASSPGAEGRCATGDGTSERHAYDEANRLNDPGVTYNEFGDITSLPSDDADGTPLESSYYADGQLERQSQHQLGTTNTQTNGYNLDPAGRTRETLNTSANATRTSDVISHYAGPGASPAWTETEGAVAEYTRSITGLDGSLTAIQSNGEAPVLQLADLHGDIVATASISETATAPISKVDVTEFGVPTTSLPPKYGWLGAIQLPTELPSGVVEMGARSYVPQLGRFLQPDPVEGGSENAYAYTFGNPINSTDPSGTIAEGGSWWSRAIVAEWANEGAEREVAREAALRAEAEAKARAAAEAAQLEAAEQAEASLNEEWYEEAEEEGSYEYVSDQRRAESGTEAHIEQGLLYQPLRESGTVPACVATPTFGGGDTSREPSSGGSASGLSACGEMVGGFGHFGRRRRRKHGHDVVLEWLGKNLTRSISTAGDLGFKMVVAAGAVIDCMDTAGVGCFAGAVVGEAADRVMHESVFKESYLP